MSRSRIRRARRKERFKKRLHIALALLAVTILIFLLTVFGGFVAVGAILSDIPDIQKQGERPNWETTKMYASDGTLLTSLYYEQDRVVVPLTDISPDLQNAVIAIEDERFYKHKGYDPEAILRAFVANLASGHTVEGASTITQQYVKNTVVTREKTFGRKIKEAALAYELEKKYTKKQILEKYLNTIYFGHTCYGVETASQNFFGKRAKELSLSEAALLAGIIKSPINFSPYTHPNDAKVRRDVVLQNMERLKYITHEQAKQAMATPVQVAPINRPAPVVPEFVEFVKQELIKRYGENVVFKGGLRVYTTVDLRMQQAAENAAWSTLDNPNDPSASIVAVEPSTGYIKVMMGGRAADKMKGLATSHNRQPGSSFKTFVFTTAIENGMSPDQRYDSSPAKIKISKRKVWNVNNYADGEGGGEMTISEALVKSVNTVYARLIMDVGPDKVVKLAKAMGINYDIKAYPAIALGGFEHGPSPLDMASAYSTIANGGRHCDPIAITKITDSSGKAIFEQGPTPKQIISEVTAYIVTGVLQDVIRSGTGTKAAIDRPCGGKTGTAQDYMDAWFCGITPELTAAVWVGYPGHREPMTNVHGIKVFGGSFPAMIWNKFMTNALNGVPSHNFPSPSQEMVGVLVCTQTGMLPNKYCPDVEYRPFAKDSVPTQKCTLHDHPTVIEVPNLVGMSIKDAKDKLNKVHFKYDVTYKQDNSNDGTVLEQTPAAGERARQNGIIDIVISSGPDGEMSFDVQQQQQQQTQSQPQAQSGSVPYVTGLYQKQARQLLGSMGYVVVISPAPQYDNSQPRWMVLEQSPAAGTQLQPGQQVTIIVNRTK